ncbi:hypothetical protein ScPMuIL_014149 [Solemya velum]
MNDSSTDFAQNSYTVEFGHSRRHSVDVRVQNLSYVVNPVSVPWWQRLSSMQFPWETVQNDTTPKQVLRNVSFTVKSGQVLAVEYVIAELGLSHVSNTKVGNAESRGISGGERRRVSIGIQLLIDPSVLLLDEPTSGLDSFTAHHLVETLSKLAKNNRTIIMSIHQPRSDIFELFDMLLLLTRGEAVYCSEASRMVDYFTGYGYPCPSLTNPCDFYIDLVTVDTTTEATETMTSDVVRSLTHAYAEASLADVTQSVSTSYGDVAFFYTTVPMPGVFRQFQVLCRRSIKNIIEDYISMATQCIEAAIMSVIIGLVYYQLGNGQADMRDRFGLLYIIIALYPFLIVLDLITQYHQERHFLFYELEDGLYFHGPYFFAKIFSELIFHTWYVIVYCVPMYFLAGLPMDIGTMGQALGITYLLVYCSRSLALWSALVMPTFQMSCFFAQTIFSMYIMSAGFFINLENILEGLKWVSSVSYLRWGYQGLCLTVIQGMNFTCASPDPRTCISTGDEALELFSLDDNYVWQACTVMSASIVFFLTLSYISLRFIPQKPND